jgi:cation:H+ antiporter
VAILAFAAGLVLGPTVLAASGEVRVPDDVLAADLLLMVAASLACVPAFWTRRTLGRIEGACSSGPT